jgi:hypothetical protein
MDNYNDKNVLKMISSLNSKSQNEIQKKLNDANKNIDYYYSIFFELLAGMMLSRQGLEINYEHKIDGKTPDWVIQQNNKIQAIVEVKSYFKKQVWKNYEIFCDAIQNELKTIPVGVSLEINYLSTIYDYKDDFMPSLIGFKEKVIDWLSNYEIEDIFEFQDIEIKILFFNKLLTYPDIGIRPTTVQWGYDTGVEKDIFNKIDKYKNIIDNNKIPYILVLVRQGDTTNFKFTDIENIFKGKVNFIYNRDKKQITNQILEKNSIVNNLDEYVNAVIFIDNQYLDKWNINVINLNENAKYKMDGSILTKINQLDNFEFEINKL